MRLFFVALLLFCVCHCRGQNRQNPFAPLTGKKDDDSSKPVTNSSTGRESENPVGIPGYSITCEIISAPSPSKPQTSLGCALVDSEEKVLPPNTAESSPIWSHQLNNSNLKVEMVYGFRGTGTLFTIADLYDNSGIETQVELLNAIRDIQIAVVYQIPGSSPMTINSKGSEEFATNSPDLYRINALCSDIFIVSLISSNNVLTTDEYTPFPTCMALVGKMNGQVTPNSIPSNPPSTDAAFNARCLERQLVEVDVGQGRLIRIPAPNVEVCIDLTSQITR